MHLLIYCAGGLGKEILFEAEEANKLEMRWQKISFIDDICSENIWNGHDIYKYNEALQLKEKGGVEVIIANGEPSVREKLWDKLQKDAFPMATIIHPTCSVHPFVKIGKGVIIEERCCVSTNVIVGDNVHIQANAILGHDVELGSHSVVSAFCGIGGRCRIGMRCFLGMSSTIKQNITIGDDVITAIGTAVFRNAKNGKILLGNPAKNIGDNSGSVFHMFDA